MGWNVDLVHSYKTIKPKHFQPFDNNKYNADYVVFTSPSTAINLLKCMGKENVPEQIISIGPVTSEEIKKETLLFTVNRLHTTQQASSDACVTYLTKRNKRSRSN